MTDTTELKVFQKISEGEAWAVCFYVPQNGRQLRAGAIPASAVEVPPAMTG